MARRKLPPIVPDAERIAAAKIAADRICAELREAALTRALWEDRPPLWHHEIQPSGWIVSRLTY